MKFKQLGKEKRDNIIAIAIGAVAVVVGLYFGLIRYQLKSYADYAAKIAEAEGKVAEGKKEQSQAQRNGEQRDITRKEVQNLDATLASGDTYEWIRRRLSLFAPKKKDFDIVEIYKPVSAVCSMFLDFPYQAQVCTISGTGYYHDIGRFVADFENQFTYFRLQNITLEPAASQSGDEKEILTFKMDIELLVANSAQ